MKVARIRDKIGHVLLGKIWILALSMVSSIYLSNLLLKEGKGELAVINSISGILSQFCNLGLHSAHTYYISKNKKNVSLSEGNVFIVFISSIIIALISYPIILLLQEIIIAPRSHVAVALGLFVVSLILMLQENIYLAIGKIFKFNIIQIASTAINIIFVFIVSFFREVDAYSVAILILIGQTVVLFFSIIDHDLPRMKIDVSFLFGILPYGLKNYVSCLITYLLLRVDVLMVRYYSTTEEVGLYSLAVNLSDMLYIFSSSVSTILFPHMSSMKGTENRLSLLRKVYLLIAPIVALVAILMFVFSKMVVGLLYGEEFIDAVPMLRILIFASFLWGLSGYIYSFFSAENHLLPTIIYPCVALVINYIFNSIMIPEYGGKGAAYASIISYLCLFACLLISVWRYSKKNNERE